MKGREVTRWRSMDKKGMYLREMAEQGYILKDMDHLTFRFQEDEPQYMRYKMETLERALTDEMRAEYAAEGWQEVCHYELEYVFSKERDPFALVDEDIRTAEDITAEIDNMIEKEKKENKTSFKIYAGIWGLTVVVGVLSFGRGMLSAEIMYGILKEMILPLLLMFFVGRFSVKKLEKKRERIQEGDIPEEYTDWRKAARKGRLSLLFWLLLGILLAWLYLKF